MISISKQHVLVIGVGIVGASISWHLAKAGARVTLVSAEFGGVATKRSFAWINASWGNPEPYFRLRQQAMNEWHRFAGNIPGLPVKFPGGMCWDLPQDELEAFAKQHSAWGYGITRLSRAEILLREPGLAKPPEFAVHASGEGMVEPILATEMILADAAHRGVELHHARVTGLLVKHDVVSGAVTAEGEMPADHVVIAAGAETAQLAATAGLTVPMAAPPGLLVRTAPHDRLLRGVVLAPQLHMRQDDEGRIIGGGDFGGSDPGTDAEATARALFAELQSMLVDGRKLRLEGYEIGYRPMPSDGFPIIGAVDAPKGLTLAVMHSGVTLAPLVGSFVAREIVSGEPEAMLRPYRLSRFGSAGREQQLPD